MAKIFEALRRRTNALGAVAVFLCFFLPQAAHAASMYFSPVSGAYDVGATFPVRVSVSSTDQAMNAASGVITFPNTKLRVSSISTGGSIVNFWTQQPSFSNETGMIRFEGVVLNPGYTGNAGTLLTINFLPIDIGSATVSFREGAVLANDGAGTNIVKSLSDATYGLGVPVAAPPVPESTTLVENPGVPAAPLITSDTHPEPSRWYAVPVAHLKWNLPAGTTNVAALVDRSPATNPVSSIGVASSMTTKALADGVWYAHVRLKNTYGWGSIAHFRLQIDTTKPERFEVTFQGPKDPTDPWARFIFDAADAVSGIDYYQIRIDNGEWWSWTDDGSHVYQSPPLLPGDHVLVFHAVDHAGNITANAGEATIAPIAAPVITEYPRTIHADETLTASGQSAPGGKVRLWVQLGNGGPTDSVEGPTDQNGQFTITYGYALQRGIYQIWATAVDSRGAQSERSDTKTVNVQASTIDVIGSLALRFLVTTILLLALTITIGFMLWFIWTRLRRMIFLLRRETDAGESHVGKVGKILQGREPLEKIKKDLAQAEAELKEELDREEVELRKGKKK